MKQVVNVIMIVVAIGVIVFFYLFGKDMLKGKPPEISADVVYTCAMHPEIELPRPGKCPKCGMQLIPRKRGMPREFLVLTDQQIQQAGVRYGKVKKRTLVKYIQTTGRITYDERKIQRITSWSGGRIDKLYVAFTGDYVKKGQLLAEIYSQKLLYVLDEFATLVKSYQDLKNLSRNNPEILKQTEESIEASRNLLRRLGMTDEQISAVEQNIKQGKPPYPRDTIPRIQIYSPLEGFVVEKLKEEGAYVEEGKDILCIADISLVWVYVDIYEYELPFVKVGEKVKITARALPEKEFEGSIVYIDPFLQPMTRTIRVRCEIENNDFLLKPGMFVNATIEYVIPDVLSVPSDAVIASSGMRDVVILNAGDGKFQPVEVRPGRKWLYPLVEEGKKRDLGYFEPYERYHEVLAGVSEGDEVVTAGAFLLHAEANFQRVLIKMLPPEEKREQKRELPSDADKVRPVLEELLKHYFKIVSELSNDSISGIRRHMQAIKDMAGNLPHAEAAHHLNALTDKEFQNIDEAREIFSHISKEVVELTKKYMPDKLKNRELYLIECSMAKFDFKQWLQPDSRITNPWFGRAMRGCGEIIN